MINLRTPFNRFTTISPDDSADIPTPDSQRMIGIYVGGAGDLSVTTFDNVSQVVFSAVPAGTILPITVRRVNAAATTATNLLALYCV